MLGEEFGGAAGGEEFEEIGGGAGPVRELATEGADGFDEGRGGRRLMEGVADFVWGVGEGGLQH